MPRRSTPPRQLHVPTRRPVRSLFSGLTALALAASGVVVLSLAAPAEPAAAAVPTPTCPPDGNMPSPGNILTYTDSNVAVFAGGDLAVVESHAEIEGLLLVQGDATIDRTPPGLVNIGSVGVGSGIVPAPGDPMFQVGGDLDVLAGNSIDVGAGMDTGGPVLVGGTATGTIQTNGASLTDGLGQAAAMSPNEGFASVIAAASTDLAAVPDTGLTVAAGNILSFNGSGAADLETFSVSATQLGFAQEISFNGVTDDSALLVNVVGADTIAFTPNFFAINGVRVDAFGPAFGNAASRILWNVVDSPNLQILGTSQVMGSWLAPNADATVNASTNGRVHVGGNLTLGGSGSEQHNYPWKGGFGLGCGGFAAQKVVTGEAANLVPADTAFTLGYSYTDGAGALVEGTLIVRADGVVVFGPSGIPDGTVVTFTEVPPLPVIPGVDWGEPVLAPTSVTVGGGQVARVTLTNVANPQVGPTDGAFAVVKQVSGGAASLVPSDTAFTVEYAYDVDGSPVTGSLDVLADGVAVQGPSLPAGTVVTFAEATPPAIDGVVWGTPVITPDSVTIGSGQVATITLENVANPVAPTPTPTPTPAPTPSDLAESGPGGTTVMLTAAGLLLVAGMVALAARRRRAVRR
ncbi:choice-of-anchor A family protein [Agromyces sp. LHK192]|uniref:choice-of-anchor A family protein n=1 Tax=Agromyces sp. LHK192 TaxID=2498704 RepID=UPI000FD904A2|nr:choice-of-anchor A family protein [Agromyces sp. LHK192]